MFHHVLSAVPGTNLFDDWREAHALWQRLVAIPVHLRALFLMPDHVHLLSDHELGGRLDGVARGFAQWRNHARGEEGQVFSPRPAPTAPKGATKQWRDERYIHLQACRARLTDDPLAWPFSTHRDAVGLAAFPVREPAAEPAAYHRRVSADYTTTVQGSSLPYRLEELLEGEAGLRRVRDAVSAVTRTPIALLGERGPVRTLLARACVCLTDASDADVGDFLGLSRATVWRAGRVHDPRVRVVSRVLGDARFLGLGAERRPWRRWRRAG